MELRSKLSTLKVVRHVYIYFLSYFFNAGLSFLTIWLLTNSLKPEDYGIINLYASFISLLTPFVTGGILYPLSVEYYKRSRPEYQKFFTNAQVIPVLSLSVLTVICIIFRNPIAHFVRVTPIWVIVLPITVWWVMNNEITMMICRVMNKPWGFAGFAIGKNITEVLLTITLVIGLHWAWQGRLLSGVVAPVIVGIFSIRFFYRGQFITRKIEWKVVRRIAWISVPFIFERLTVFVLSNSDRYFIDKYDLNGTAQVGLYSVGAQIATIITLVILSMNSAYQPYIFQNLASGHKERSKKGTGMFILAAALLVGSLFLAIPILFQFFIGHQFKGAQVFAYYLCGGNFMWAIYNAFLAYLLFHGKNRLILYLSLSGMMVSAILNFILVPHYGAYGAAMTNIITYSLMALLSVMCSWKYFK